MLAKIVMGTLIVLNFLYLFVTRVLINSTDEMTARQEIVSWGLGIAALVSVLWVMNDVHGKKE